MKRLFNYNSAWYYWWLHIVVFFCVYSVQFVGVPMDLGSRVILSFFGFLLFCREILKKELSFRFSKKFLFILFSLLGMVCFSLMSLFLNKTTDFEFVKYAVSIVLIFFAGYYVVNQISKRFDLSDGSIIMKIIINVVFIQVVIALLMFLIQPFRDFLNAIQVISELNMKLSEGAVEFRLFGFGSKFFGAGIVNGVALIMIASLLKFDKESKESVLKYSFMFLVVFAFGMMMARTTIIGFIFAFVIFLFPQSTIDFKIFKRILKFISYMVFTPIVLIFLLFYFVPSFKETMEMLSNYGFEMFVNYFDSGSLETSSTNELGEMYFWPTQIKTYLIGDGYFTDPYTKLYYMGSDVGIIRLLYFFGILGTVTYFLMEFAVIRQAYSNYPRFKIMFLLLFLYCVFLNFKGFTDIVFLVILFCYGGNTLVMKEELVDIEVVP